MSESLEQHKQLARLAGCTPAAARALLEDPRARSYLDIVLKQLEAFVVAQGRRAEIRRMREAGHTQREIAEALGVSQPRVQQLLR